MDASILDRLIRPLPCLALLAASCGGGSSDESTPLIRFEETTQEAHIDFTGLTWGLAWGDGNADGRPDLWSSNHGSDPHLYMNVGEGRFARIRKPYLTPTPGDSHGVAWGDFDGDGDEDLLELTGAQRGVGTGMNHLYVNEDKTLVDGAAELGLGYELGRGRTPLWLDWDRDGALDVLIANADREEAPTALFLQRGGTFEIATVPFGEEQAYFAQLVPFGEGERPHVFVHAHRFPQAVYDLSTDPPTEVREKLGLERSWATEDVVFADFDGDGRTDFFVAKGWLGCELFQVDEHLVKAKIVVRNDVRGLTLRCEGPLDVHVRPFYRDWWPGSTVSIGAEGKVPESNRFTATRTEAAGKWDESMTEGFDKRFFVLHDPDTNLWHLLMHSGIDEGSVAIRSEAPITDVEPVGFTNSEPPLDGLVCYREGRYVDVADRAGFLPTNSLAAAAGDFDNDMDVDLYVLRTWATRGTPNLVYENLGDGTFRALVDGAGAGGALVGTSDTCAVADYDGDGHLDIAVANGREISTDGGPLQLFRNRGTRNHWLRIELAGTRSNPEGLGALVTVEAGGVRQTRMRGNVMHRGAQDERTLHFGLGPNTVADRVRVEWPAGGETLLENVPADRCIDVTE